LLRFHLGVIALVLEGIQATVRIFRARTKDQVVLGRIGRR
jgi:hypothetical protein